MSIQLKAGKVTQDKRLDRIVQFDERSRQYPIRHLIAATSAPRSYTWRCDVYLNQKSEGACAGFAVTHEAAAKPVRVLGLTEQIARDVYHRAQDLDEWPGHDYEGTSVLGAMKAGKEKGWYEEYRWAFGIDDLVLALGYKGPAVLGINWYEGMFETDSGGFIHPTGQLMGGHAIVAIGVSLTKQSVRLHNSWGIDWGVHGECQILISDLKQLLKEDGEAAIPVKRGLGTATSSGAAGSRGTADPPDSGSGNLPGASPGPPTNAPVAQ